MPRQKPFLKEFDGLGATIPEDELRRIALFNVNPFEELVQIFRRCGNLESTIAEMLEDESSLTVRRQLGELKARFDAIQQGFTRSGTVFLRQEYPGSN